MSETLPVGPSMISCRPSFAASVVDLPIASYYIGPGSEVNVLKDYHRGPLVVPAVVKPAILLSVQEGSDNESIKETVESFYNDDDVFSDDFLTDTVSYQRFGGDALGLNASDGPWKPLRVITIQAQDRFPPGPYFLLSDTALAQAWRLFSDTQDAFTTTFVHTPDDSTRFDPVNVTSKDGLWCQVAVPSRLYSTPTTAKPLTGKRVSVKDNFQVAGVRTTQNNRAWVNLYGPESETALYIKQLVELGAVIVGKTKMNAFASAEGTTGGGVALASYNWLDYSVGTDTTGSIRWPAAISGLYGRRASWGSTSLDVVYPSCKSMDAIGLLARDVGDLDSLTEHSFGFPAQSKQRLPKRILYCTDFLPHQNKAQNDLVEEFVIGLEAYLGVERTNISIPERWAQCPPPEAKGKDLETYTNKTAYNLFYYDGYNEFSDFRKDYEDKFGKPPYLGPYMHWKWERGAEVTLEQKQQAEKELAVYRRWFQETVMQAEDSGGSDAVLILPCGSADPKYRDLPNPGPKAASAHNLNYVSPMHSLPQIVVPVGQIPFESRISKRTEYLPITASMASATGSDLMLIALAKAGLVKANMSTKVHTRRYAFKI